MTRRRYIKGVSALTLASLAVVACGGDETSDLAGAFCADLEAGMSVGAIVAGAGPIVDDPTPQRTAAQVYVYVEEGCPGRLDTDEGLRSYLGANGIDPDA
jgi:hypothetical protein